MGVFLRVWLFVPSSLRLRLYRALIRIGLWLYGPTDSPRRCFRLPFNLYAKNSPSMAEPNTLHYIAKYINTQTPRVIDAIPMNNRVLFVMTRIAGEPLSGKLGTMSEEEHTRLASDLKRFFDQLRALPPPSSGPQICGIGGGPFICYRIKSHFIGPFDTEPDFYRYLYDYSHLPWQDHLRQFCQKVHSRQHRICLTHNDLVQHNILVDSDNRFAGLIDWECAAWLPDYWEYTRAYYQYPQFDKWVQLLKGVFGTWPDELDAEMEMWKYNDPW